MTQDELKQAIDNYPGLVGELGRGRDECKIIYYSLTGVKLFDISIGNFDDGDGWQFLGHSGAVPLSWETLCHIHEQVKV